MKETQVPLLSVVIPAYNEAEYIREALDAVHTALAVSGLESSEVIVADDDSTDSTAEIAEAAGALVVHSGKRNIGATRNVGARAACGEYLLFLDADTSLVAENISELLEAMRDDALAGGAPVAWSGRAPFWYRLASGTWNLLGVLFKLPAGSFFFVKNDAFEKVGGFDEEHYVAEELYLARKLKRLGKLRLLSTPVASSPRKAFQFSAWDFAKVLFRTAFSPFGFTRKREGLEMWYERRR